MTNYLLEKSRVTGQAEGERCFHVMHYLLEGANELEREEFQLLPQRWVGGWVSVCWWRPEQAAWRESMARFSPAVWSKTPLTCTMECPFRPRSVLIARNALGALLPQRWASLV